MCVTTSLLLSHLGRRELSIFGENLDPNWLGQAISFTSGFRKSSTTGTSDTGERSGNEIEFSLQLKCTCNFMVLKSAKEVMQVVKISSVRFKKKSEG